MTEPTEEGKERWGPDGYYDTFPCTCTEQCEPGCRGECGCEACGMAYCDYLSMDID